MKLEGSLRLGTWGREGRVDWHVYPWVV